MRQLQDWDARLKSCPLLYFPSVLLVFFALLTPECLHFVLSLNVGLTIFFSLWACITAFCSCPWEVLFSVVPFVRWDSVFYRWCLPCLEHPWFSRPALRCQMSHICNCNKNICFVSSSFVLSNIPHPIPHMFKMMSADIFYPIFIILLSCLSQHLG